MKKSPWIPFHRGLLDGRLFRHDRRCQRRGGWSREFVKKEGVILIRPVFELSGAELDYAVSKAAGLRCELKSGDKCTFSDSDELFEPSVNWIQGGPIIEMANLRVEPPSRGMKLWSVSAPEHPARASEWGATLLEAAMRCFVAARLGDEILIRPAPARTEQS